MFSAVLKFLHTSTIIPHNHLLKICCLTATGAEPLPTLLAAQIIRHYSSSWSIELRRPQHEFTLADKRRESNRFYWNSIRKRFQSTDTTKSSAKSKNKRSLNKKMNGERCWETLLSSCGEGEEIVVMSYNILAQHLLNTHKFLYENHNWRNLAWDYRLNLIVRHIESISPQILCLQEVEQSHLSELSKRLVRLGLDQHIFKKRTNTDYRDGCAIFYRSDCFCLIDFHRVEFFQPNIKVSCCLWFLSKRIVQILIIIYKMYNAFITAPRKTKRCATGQVSSSLESGYCVLRFYHTFVVQSQTRRCATRSDSGLVGRNRPIHIS